MSQGGGGAGCDSGVIFQRLIDDLLMILNGQLATEIEELVAFREHGKDVEELQLVGTMRETWGNVRRDVTTMLRLGQDLHQRHSECSPKKKIKSCHHYPELRVEQLASRVGRRGIVADMEPMITFITDLGGSIKVGPDDNCRLFQ